MVSQRRRVDNNSIILAAAASLEQFYPDLANWPEIWKVENSDREQALHPGDYAYIPVKRVHWGSCPEPCMFYLSIDGPDSFNVVEEKK